MAKCFISSDLAISGKYGSKSKSPASLCVEMVSWDSSRR